MTEGLHNHTENAEKFESALDKDAEIYQQREQKSGWEQFKALHGAEKWQFFIDYYLRTVIVIVVIAALAGYFIYDYVTNEEYVLNILAINTYGDGNDEAEEEFFNGFLEEHDFNPKKQCVSVSRSLYIGGDSDGTAEIATSEVVATRFAANQVDLLFSDPDYFMYGAANDFFADLEEYLTPEEIDTLGEDRLVYASVVYDDEEEEEEESSQILVGIRLDPSSGWLEQMNWYLPDQEVVAGIGCVVQDVELTVSLLHEILAL